MKQLILIIYLTGIIFQLKAQSKITYLDTKYNEVSKSKAYYIQENFQSDDTIFKKLTIKSSGILIEFQKYGKLNPEMVNQKAYNISTGKIKYEGWLLNKLKIGEWKYYNYDGDFISVREFKNGNEIKYKCYHRNGIIKKEVEIKNQLYHGLYKYYDKEGKLVCEGIYNEGKEDKNFNCTKYMNEADSQSTTKEPFLAVQQMPEYQGGENEMMKYIVKNIEYPEKAIEASIEGVVRIKFTVGKDGVIYNTKVISKDLLGYGCERVALEVVENMQQWNPGLQNNIPVPVYYNLPIRFRLY